MCPLFLPLSRAASCTPYESCLHLDEQEEPMGWWRGDWKHLDYSLLPRLPRLNRALPGWGLDHINRNFRYPCSLFWCPYSSISSIQMHPYLPFLDKSHLKLNATSYKSPSLNTTQSCSPTISYFFFSIITIWNCPIYLLACMIIFWRPYWNLWTQDLNFVECELPDIVAVVTLN